MLINAYNEHYCNFGLFYSRSSIEVLMEHSRV
jgi:hypothetical protein